MQATLPPLPQEILDKLTPEQLAAAQKLATLIAPYYNPPEDRPSVIDWAEANFYLEDTQAPIVWRPHQKVILKVAFNPQSYPALANYPPFQTIVFSTVKKSGKTTVAGVVGRWVAETFGRGQEVYCMANDMEQARGRIYQSALDSIINSPGFITRGINGTLPGKWRIIDRETRHIPSNSIIKAISADYKGAAGSNPTATLWSELWGFTKEADRRLWQESTPVPTRPYSFRFVETYAGYEGESELLWDLWQKIINSRQLTRDDIPDWPYPDEYLLPLYVNEAARMFGYIDSGVIARRMQWQTPEYYEAEAHDLTPLSFDRLHLNLWTASTAAFVPIEWWDRLQVNMPPLLPGDKTPIIIGVDASVKSDCTACVAVSRHPTDATAVQVRLSKSWQPTNDQPMDYGLTLEPTLREWCANYNIVQIAYDAYQLHDLMTRLRRDGITWCREFGQNTDRSEADKSLFDIIRDKRITHDGDVDIRSHIQGAASKQSTQENTKLRIIKKAESSKIDLVIALSMAAKECLRLNL